MTTLAKAARLDLADSALHAPRAGFGDEDFYPSLHQKAAVMTCRLVWNHPLPDGNKRTAWESLRVFLLLNGGVWIPDLPSDHEVEAVLLALASHEIDEASFTDWLLRRVRFCT